MTDNSRTVSDAQLYAFQNMHTELERALDLATDLLADVRSKLMAELPALDKVGADALMISALVV